MPLTEELRMRLARSCKPWYNCAMRSYSICKCMTAADRSKNTATRARSDFVYDAARKRDQRLPCTSGVLSCDLLILQTDMQVPPSLCPPASSLELSLWTSALLPIIERQATCTDLMKLRLVTTARHACRGYSTRSHEAQASLHIEPPATSTTRTLERASCPSQSSEQLTEPCCTLLSAGAVCHSRSGTHASLP
jgi:hypothetical protein